MSTRGTVIRNTLFSSVGIYTEYLLGMLTSIIIARHLGPADFGAYSLVIWLVATGVVITNAGVASAVIKFVAELRGSGREAQIRSLLGWAWRVQAGFLAVVLLGGTALFLLQGQRLMPGFNHGLLLVILLVTTTLRASYMLNIGIAKGYENFRATAAIAIIVAPLNLLLILVVWWFDGPMEWFLGSFTVSSFVFWWISRRQIAPLLPPRAMREPLDEDTRRRLRSYTALVAVTVAVSFVTASEVEVLFLTLFDSSASAGQFKVAFQLASGALLLVPGVFGALLLPMMANALAQGREVANRRLAMSTTYLAGLAAPLVAFGMVFAQEIIGLLYGAAFSPAALVFACCLAAGSIPMLSQAASGYLLGSDRQRALMFAVLACSLVKVGLDVALIRIYGLGGAVVAYAATSVLTGSLVIGLALHYSGARMEWSRIARVLLSATLAAAAAWLVRGHLPPVPTLAIGGMLLATLYAAGTVLLGFWSAADLQHFQQLHARLGKGRPAFLARILVWAVRRAEAAP
ncbi:oligosaccharide flippase family protein [Luteimonas viscosa]|uniref:Oligosaccharide flippase family protein n=1 Tax=Luteimonas viscosa TaxID=1132694 RepID=A0A5D4XI40_9GAMM|nr:oligosaccharide flippase family protein [Luteimonas viscosa]TYT23595.1 oligosaccharide flippase family protein [Luteimonas viscosa]